MRAGFHVFALGCLFLIALGYAALTSAATLFITPPTRESGVGQRITVDVKVDGGGVSFNAAQAVVRFPRDILAVATLDKSNSAFSFWLEEPKFSNAEGVISFIGGTPYGVSGSAIQILKITFLTKGSGEAPLTITDAAVTASDGSGTNILAGTGEAAVRVSPARLTPPPAVPPPQQLHREPVPALGLPGKPVFHVPLYPEPLAWYNRTAPFAVSWELGPDISGISTAINKQPSAAPPAKSEGLFDNRMFTALDDGVWYLHVRFQNSRGWGPTAHHRIAIDTQPPLGFDVTVREGESTDTPTPTLEFKTSDALSGLENFLVRIGDGDLLEVPTDDFSGGLRLPRQAPGRRRVVVRAADRAGNSIESGTTLDTLPITSPTITFVTPELYSDGKERLSASGSAAGAALMRLGVHRVGAELVASGLVAANADGRWEFALDQPLRNGRYVLSAQAEDARGALSLAVDSPEFRVRSTPIVRVGAFELGKGGALIFLLLLLAGGFGGGIWFYRVERERLTLRVLVTETDVTKVFKLIQEDIERMRQAQRTATPADDEFVLKKLQENIEKMASYLKREVQKIKG